MSAWYVKLSDLEEDVSILSIDEQPQWRVRFVVRTFGVVVCALAGTAALVRGLPHPSESLFDDDGRHGGLAPLRTSLPVTATASNVEVPEVVDKATSNDYAQNLVACNSWDDDSKWDSTCGKDDFHAWCNHSETVGSGSSFFKYCGAACEGDDASTSYAMVCAWEAVAQLPSICVDNFNSTTPANLSRDLPNDFARTTLDLWDCDEHAFCNSCSTGNKYCSAVAHHYGGVGVPYNLTEGLEYTYVHTPTGETKIGANAAMRVLNDDLHYWCDKATLSAIESGDFFRDYR